MAQFQMELPDEILKQFDLISTNSEKIIGEMCKAGAKVVDSSIKSNVPASFHGSNIMKCLKKTKVYKTPSDDGINVKVGFWGYFVNKKGEQVPAPLVCNQFEYGNSRGFPKRPFLRKSFDEGAITAAMLAAQKKASGGLLE